MDLLRNFNFSIWYYDQIGLTLTKQKVKIKIAVVGFFVGSLIGQLSGENRALAGMHGEQVRSTGQPA